MPHGRSEISGGTIEGSCALLIFPQASEGGIEAFLELASDVGDGGNAVEIPGFPKAREPGEEIVPDVIGKGAGDGRQRGLELLNQFVEGVTGRTLKSRGGGRGGTASRGLVMTTRVKVRGRGRGLGAFLSRKVNARARRGGSLSSTEIGRASCRERV